MRMVGSGRVHSRPEWSDCCWPGCMRLAEGGGPPLCQKHINDVIEDHEREKIRWTAEAIAEGRRESEQRAAIHAAERARIGEGQSQVYYVRIGDRVKIGYSINLKQRLNALRVPESALLATEPGGRQLERERHLQFAAERVGRREDFNPSRRLLAHIEAIKAEHGDPKLTTWPRVSI